MALDGTIVPGVECPDIQSWFMTKVNDSEWDSLTIVRSCRAGYLNMIYFERVLAGQCILSLIAELISFFSL